MIFPWDLVVLLVGLIVAYLPILLYRRPERRKERVLERAPFVDDRVRGPYR